MEDYNMKKLELTTIKKDLPTQYKGMLDNVSKYFPVIAKATRNFNKSQSQFMNNMLTLSQPTELRSLRQILSEVERTKQALDGAFFKMAKTKIKIKRKQRKLAIEKDDLNKEMLQIEIAELQSQISNSMGYVEGAIRKISAYMSQYKNVLKYLGKKEITEEDFEKDEERYHIMKVFEQALCAARSHGGTIDEGNHIYFYQIGINGTAAQVEISKYLANEGKIYSENNLPEHDNTWKWMHKMADKYSGCAKKFAKNKHMKLIQSESLHKDK